MAGQYFSKRRGAELSLIEHIETQMNASWSNPIIPVVKSFEKAYEVPVPVISVGLEDVDNERLEIGDNILKQAYNFTIHIFAKSDGQRIDLAEFIVQAVKGGCIRYNYSHSSSSKETLDKVADGRMTLLTFVSDSKIEIGNDQDAHDKFRHSITFTMR